MITLFRANYGASSLDCGACPLKPRCCPTTPERKVRRSIFEGARDMAREITPSDAFVVSSGLRKKIEMLFAHLKRILGLHRLRLRGPNGARVLSDNHLGRCRQPPWPVGLNGRRACPSGGQPHRPE